MAHTADTRFLSAGDHHPRLRIPVRRRSGAAAICQPRARRPSPGPLRTWGVPPEPNEAEGLIYCTSHREEPLSHHLWLPWRWRVSAQILWSHLSPLISIWTTTRTGTYQRTRTRWQADKLALTSILGDTSASEKHTNRANAAQQYVDQQRYFAALLARGIRSSAITTARATLLDGTTNNCAWFTRDADEIFEPPAPGGRNHYAWETTNTLFIALDLFHLATRLGATTTTGSAMPGKRCIRWLT